MPSAPIVVRALSASGSVTPVLRVTVTARAPSGAIPSRGRSIANTSITGSASTSFAARSSVLRRQPSLEEEDPDHAHVLRRRGAGGAQVGQRLAARGVGLTPRERHLDAMHGDRAAGRRGRGLRSARGTRVRAARGRLARLRRRAGRAGGRVAADLRGGGMGPPLSRQSRAGGHSRWSCRHARRLSGGHSLPAAPPDRVPCSPRRSVRLVPATLPRAGSRSPPGFPPTRPVRRRTCPCRTVSPRPRPFPPRRPSRGSRSGADAPWANRSGPTNKTDLTTCLPFERPVFELERKLDELMVLSDATDMHLNGELKPLLEKRDRMLDGDRRPARPLGAGPDRPPPPAPPVPRLRDRRRRPSRAARRVDRAAGRPPLRRRQARSRPGSPGWARTASS